MPVLLDHLALFILRELPVHVVLFLELVREQRRIAVVSYCLIYHKICLRPFKTQTYIILNGNKDKFQVFVFLIFAKLAVIRFRHFDMVPEIGERPGLRIEFSDVFILFSDMLRGYQIASDIYAVFADASLHIREIFIYGIFAAVWSAEHPDVFFLFVLGMHFPALGRNWSVHRLISRCYCMLMVRRDFIFLVRAVRIISGRNDIVQMRRRYGLVRNPVGRAQINEMLVCPLGVSELSVPELLDFGFRLLKRNAGQFDFHLHFDFSD